MDYCGYFEINSNESIITNLYNFFSTGLCTGFYFAIAMLKIFGNVSVFSAWLCLILFTAYNVFTMPLYLFDKLISLSKFSNKKKENNHHFNSNLTFDARE